MDIYVIKHNSETRRVTSDLDDAVKYFLKLAGVSEGKYNTVLDKINNDGYLSNTNACSLTTTSIDKCKWYG